MAGSPQPKLRLLSLDGGGVRGLSSIIILKDIMRGLNQGRHTDNQLHPWQVFDLIGGTSTGGLIAIMLGRLRMSIEECEAAYLTLSEKVFIPKRSAVNIFGRAKDTWKASGRLNTEALELVIKQTVRECQLSSGSLFKDPDSPCEVFVCAVLSSNTRACLLRSYENIGMPELLYDSCKIWEACRATCAATRFFDPITIGPYQQRFVDGAFQHNNPISMVYREASYLWPSRVEDAVLVSTGTGRAPAPVLEGNIIDVMDALKNIALETESTADDFFADHRSMASKDLLYRFNAYPGLTEVGLDEYNQSRKIADATHAYMSTGETRRQWENCLQKLRNDDCNKNMYDAIEKGDLSRLKEALEEGADIEADNGKPLRNASLKGHAGMVKILLCRGAAINSQGETKQTALHIAAALGNTAAIAVLLEHGPNVDARDIDELTALHYVCSIGNEEIAKLLLDYRADIEAISDPNNMTPLQVAASLGSAQLVKLLLDRGANINALGNPGQSALQWAVVFGHKSVLEILLDHKPNVNMRNNQFIGEWKDGIEEIFEVDLMPLHSAAYFGDGPMVRTLLDHGAHINATTGAKHHLQHFRTTTSLHLAMLCHHTSAARATHTATVALLIERGADLRAKDFEGYTPLERGERVANKENHPAKHIAAALTSLLREALSRKH